MNTAKAVLSLALLAGLGVSGVLAQPAGHGQSPPAKEAAPAATRAKRVGDPYPLGTCPVSGEKLGEMGDPVVKLYDGREVRFCCKECPPKFEKDLAASLAKLDEQIIKDQGPLYPLTTSVVTGKDLPAKPYEFVYGNRLIRLGAEGEKGAFLKEPAKFLGAIDQAVIEAQGKDYPLQTCPVSKEKLGSMGKPVDMVVAGRLIRLCCKACKKDLDKEPWTYIAKVDGVRSGSRPGADAKPPEEKHDQGK